MKNLDFKSMLIGVLLAMLIVAFTIVATAEKTPGAWDYKVVRPHSLQWEPTLNKAASEGWEVVAVASGEDSGDTRGYVVMKRPSARQQPGWWKIWKK